MRRDGLNTRVHTRCSVKCQGGHANGQDDGGRRDGHDGALEVEQALWDIEKVAKAGACPEAVFYMRCGTGARCGKCTYAHLLQTRQTLIGWVGSLQWALAG
jgi:hypothetical protein